MRIDFISRDNCDFTPEILWGRGVGGAEYALMFLAEELGQQGHDVVIWNSVPRHVRYGAVTYLPVAAWSPTIKTDVAVIFRVAIPHRPTNAKAVVFFSCDQATSGGWDVMFPWLDAFICISEFHKAFISRTYGYPPDKISVVELGANIHDYQGDVMAEKVPGRMIYCSVPHRGLQLLLPAWPHIRARVPDATLTVTSDYRLWGRGSDPGNHDLRAAAASLDGVEFLGAVPRADLVRHQREAEIMAFPCTYDECFCISAAECQAAGAVPVTFAQGAVGATVGDRGVVLPPPAQAAVPAFVNEVVALAQDHERRRALARKGVIYARRHYSYAAVAARLLGVVRPVVEAAGVRA